jgi:hypothetical protein
MDSSRTSNTRCFLSLVFRNTKNIYLTATEGEITDEAFSQKVFYCTAVLCTTTSVTATEYYTQE